MKIIWGSIDFVEVVEDVEVVEVVADIDWINFVTGKGVIVVVDPAAWQDGLHCPGLVKCRSQGICQCIPLAVSSSPDSPPSVATSSSHQSLNAFAIVTPLICIIFDLYPCAATCSKQLSINPPLPVLVNVLDRFKSIKKSCSYCRIAAKEASLQLANCGPTSELATKPPKKSIITKKLLAMSEENLPQ